MTTNITVQRIVGVLLQRIKLIVLATVVCTLLFFTYSKFFIAPQYYTSAMIYVQNYNGNGTGANEENQKIYSSDISGSSTLAKICVTLFQNSDELTALYDGCAVSMSVNADTFFITISVSGSDSQKCANVANQVADQASVVFKEHFQYGQLGVIRSAKAPGAASSPSHMKNALIGFAVGLIASCAISILIELIDTTIKSDDDIQKMYNLPVFAEIPDFDNQG